MPETKVKFQMKPLRPNERTKRHYAHRLGPGKIMVVREKHSTRYLKASTLREFCAAALFLLDERWGPDGYWGTADTQIKEYEGYIAKIPKPELTVEDLVEKTGASAESGIVIDLKGKWQEHRKLVRENTGELDMYRRIKKAVEERNGLMAAQVLIDRNGYEYESWDFERIEAPLED